MYFVFLHLHNISVHCSLRLYLGNLVSFIFHIFYALKYQNFFFLLNIEFCSVIYFISSFTLLSLARLFHCIHCTFIVLMWFCCWLFSFHVALPFLLFIASSCSVCLAVSIHFICLSLLHFMSQLCTCLALVHCTFVPRLALGIFITLVKYFH